MTLEKIYIYIYIYHFYPVIFKFDMYVDYFIWLNFNFLNLLLLYFFKYLFGKDNDLVVSGYIY